MDNFPSLHIDVPHAGIIRLTLQAADGGVVDIEDVVYQGPVDNLLLTAVDNLLRRSKLHKSALKIVTLGAGIDKNSSLYRIVQSFASAVAVAHRGLA
jgi:hypothetical protein